MFISLESRRDFPCDLCLVLLNCPLKLESSTLNFSRNLQERIYNPNLGWLFLLLISSSHHTLYILYATQRWKHHLSLTECNLHRYIHYKLGRKREEWQLGHLRWWCFGVSTKEAYQCMTVRLSGGHTTRIVAVHCTTWKVFAPTLALNKDMCHSTRKLHGKIVPCTQQLPNPLHNLLFLKPDNGN